MAAYERIVNPTGSASSAGSTFAAVRRSSRPSESTTRRTSRLNPTASVARMKSRRRRPPASARRSGNELLGDPPQEGAGREPHRAPEDRRANEGAEVGMHGVARPEDDRGADHRGRGERERAIGFRDGAEPVEGDDGRQPR